MSLTLHHTSENDLPVMHAILRICGEHMHRTQDLHHWYPYRSLDAYLKLTDGADVYAMYDDDLLAGTFYVTENTRDWYAPVEWTNADHKPLYFGGFGVLPMTQGRGIGRWAMSQADALAQSGGYDVLRFDGVYGNEPLMRFYEKLGYTRIMLLSKPGMSYTNAIFEKVFV